MMKMFIHYLSVLTELAQKATYDNFVIIQKVRSDILNSYANGELSEDEKGILFASSSIIMKQMRNQLSAVEHFDEL